MKKHLYEVAFAIVVTAPFLIRLIAITGRAWWATSDNTKVIARCTANRIILTAACTSPMTACPMSATSEAFKTNMKGNYEDTYWKVESKVERFGDWCEKHIGKAKELALTFCERNYSYPFVERVSAVLKRKRPQHRLIIHSRCIGCDPKYRKQLGLWIANTASG